METVDFWNKMAETYPSYNEASLVADAGRLLGFAAEAGLAWRGLEVIDIGCGSGAMALRLAAEGARVSALDPSAGMLAKLREGIEATGTQGIVMIESAWETFGALQPEGAFALGVASMTPAVATSTGLAQMVRSCRHGIVAAWGRYRRNSFAEALFEALRMRYAPSVNGIRRLELGLKRLGVEPKGPFYFETAWVRELSAANIREEAARYLGRELFEARQDEVEAWCALLPETVKVQVEVEKGVVVW